MKQTQYAIEADDLTRRARSVISELLCRSKRLVFHIVALCRVLLFHKLGPILRRKMSEDYLLRSTPSEKVHLDPIAPIFYRLVHGIRNHNPQEERKPSSRLA